MSTIRDAVAAYVKNTRYTERDHEVALEWMNATKCGGDDVHLLAAPVEKLGTEDRERRNQIRSETIGFVRRRFDDRPDIAQSLDNLLAELVGDDETKRRGEFLPFEHIYSREEIAVLLMKHLQPTHDRGRYTREDIAEYFLTSARTIGKHIRAMLPTADREQCARVLGEVVQMEPDHGTNVPESTTHPVFLPLTMVELYTLVDKLVEHANDPVEGRIVRSVLRRIHRQTTGYARERLARIEGLEDALSLAGSPNAGRDHGEEVMFSEKEGVRATVTYEKDGEELTCTGFISRGHRNRAIVNVYDGRTTHRIPYRHIISVEPCLK